MFVIFVSYIHIWFLENSETFPLKCSFFLLFCDLKFLLQYKIVKQLTIISNCYNHSFWTNKVPLFKVLVFNVALLYSYCITFTFSCCTFFVLHYLMFHHLMLLYLMIHYFPFALVIVAVFNLLLF